METWGSALTGEESGMGLTLNWVVSTISISTRGAGKSALIFGGNINHFTMSRKEKERRAAYLHIVIYFCNNYFQQSPNLKPKEIFPFFFFFNLPWFIFWLIFGCMCWLIYISYSLMKRDWCASFLTPVWGLLFITLRSNVTSVKTEKQRQTETSQLSVVCSYHCCLFTKQTSQLSENRLNTFTKENSLNQRLIENINHKAIIFHSISNTFIFFLQFCSNVCQIIDVLVCLYVFYNKLHLHLI